MSGRATSDDPPDEDPDGGSPSAAPAPSADYRGSPVGPRGCGFRMPDGRLCGATRRREVPRCFSHDPGSSGEADEARRLGGLRRRREHAVAAAFDLAGISSLDEWGRVAEIATLDALTLANGIGRATALAALIRVGVQLYAARELEARLTALEAAHAPTPPRASGTTLLADAERLAGSVR